MSEKTDRAVERRQAVIDRFYKDHGPCCAGCDWWHHVNSVAGECHRSAPVDGVQRFAMLGITASTLSPESGQVMTPRHHHCGEFKDTHNWNAAAIGASGAT